MRFPLCFSWITEFNVHDRGQDKWLCGFWSCAGFTNRKEKIEGFCTLWCISPRTDKFTFVVVRLGLFTTMQWLSICTNLVSTCWGLEIKHTFWYQVRATGNLKRKLCVGVFSQQWWVRVSCGGGGRRGGRLQWLNNRDPVKGKTLSSQAGKPTGSANTKV